MKRIKQLALCALLPVLLLSGCRLAKPEAAEAAENDRLIGVFVTWEHLDLFDFGSYLGDNVNKIMQGGEISQEESQRYSGRIYAVLKTETLTAEDGSQQIHGEYVFEDIEGVAFFMPYITLSENESYWAATSSPALSGTKVAVGSQNELEGTIYVTPQGPRAMYPNPVYQEPGGNVYVTTGTGMSHGGDFGEGTAFTQTISETHTVTENGEEIKEGTSIKITLAVRNPPRWVTFIQMSGDNTPLFSRGRYDSGLLPEAVEFGPETAYVIAETRSDSPEDEKISREILTAGDSWFSTLVPRADGVLEGRGVSLVWK